MSYCHGCAKNFGFLNKEYGCEKCGFAFCSKCLVKKRCKNCLTMTSTAQEGVTQMPPVVVQEKLEKLENPNRTPIVVYTHSSRLSQLKRGLSTEDQELVDRLSKLKSEIREMRNTPSQDEIEQRFAKLKGEIRELKEIPSQEEIEERLARLRGVDPSVYKSKPAAFVAKPPSNVDPTTELLNQVREEVAIDRGSDPLPSSTDTPMEPVEDDVEMLLRKEAQAIQSEARLAFDSLRKDKEIQDRLKELKLSKKNEAKDDKMDDDDDDSDDEERQAASIIQRAMAESRLELDEELEALPSVNKEDELPWCELCNEDAQLRCFGCDRDLYCRRCWKETHKEPELKSHRIENYKA